MAGTNIYGQLIKAQLQNAAANLTPVSTGLIYFDTVAVAPTWYNGSAWRTAMDLETAQTVSGEKTFSGQLRIQSGTVTEPAIVFTSDDDATGTGLYRIGTNNMGFAANGVTTGNIAATGLWTIGDLGVAVEHIIQSSDNVPLILKSASATCHLQFNYSTSSIGGYIRTTSSVPFNFLNASAASVGSVTDTGLWTLGIPSASTNTVVHKVNGILGWGGTGLTDDAPAMGVYCNANFNGASNRKTGSTTVIGGAAIYLDARTNDTAPCITFLGQPKASGDATAATTFGQMTQDGTWKNNAASWSLISDSRLKKNVVTLTGSLDKIMALRPIAYEWDQDNPNPMRPTVGFLAQEIELIFPNIVGVSQEIIVRNGVEVTIEDAKHLNLGSEMFANLVKAIQELKDDYDAYKVAHP